MSRPRVIIVSEYFGKDVNSTGAYLEDIAGFLNDDFEVKIVTLGLKHAQFLGPRVEPVYYEKNNFYSRVKGQISVSLALLRAVWKLTESGDTLFSVSNPVLMQPGLALIRCLKKVKWVCLHYDIFPENLIRTAYGKAPLWLKVVDKLFGAVNRRNDIALVIGRDMKAVLASKGVSKDNVRYIPNWVDFDAIKVNSTLNSAFKNKLGWEGNVMFVFFGNLGRLQGLEVVVEAIKEVDSGCLARFAFFGDGARRELIEQLVQTDDRCYYGGAVPMSENIETLNLGDVALISLQENMYGLGVPSKGPFSLAANKPIFCLVDKGSELQLVNDELDVGWVQSNYDPTVVAERIEMITAEVCSGLAKDVRKISFSRFDISVAREQYRNLMREVCSSK